MQTEEQKIITTRCIECRAEFTEIETVDANCCPKCGTKSTPEDPRQDVEVRINWHALRILCMWAKNWESHFTKQEPERYEGQVSIIDILTAQLSKYRPEGAAPLSFAEELQEVAEHFNTKVTLFQNGEETEFDGKKTVH